MITILFGLIGLSLVVLVHEFGHFLVARLVGVEVEAFSVGMGPVLFRRKGRTTEWRLSALPLGGYCKLKGEESFRKAIEHKLDAIPVEPGDFYAARPGRRILIALAGPAVNVLFAILAFAVTAAVGTTFYTAPNRILLASEIQRQNEPNPADIAGLQTGDTIIEIQGRTIRDYSDLQEIIASNPDSTLAMKVLRQNQVLELTVTPKLDRDTGAGMIGVYAWIDPVIESIAPGSPAALADIRPGDRILEVNGMPIRATADLIAVFRDAPEKLDIAVARSGETVKTTMVAQNLADTGITFTAIKRTERAANPVDALKRGVRQTFDTVTMTVKSIGLLFRGVNVFKAVSGPARITYLIGNVTTQSLRNEGLAGLVQVLSFLAFLSVGLAIMNLLPLPVLDGGLILVFLVEIIRRRPLAAASMYRYQFIGAVIVLALFFMVTMSDILFFLKK